MDEIPLTDQSDAELLTPGRDQRPLPRNCLRRFGSLRSLLQAPSGDILACHGIGRGRLAALARPA